MIKCSKCGHENQDTNKFCAKCGSPLVLKKRCPSCGAELEKDAAFCGNCGKKVEPENLFCTNCGAKLTEGTKFCVKCGTPASGIQPATVESVPPAAEPANVSAVSSDAQSQAGSKGATVSIRTESGEINYELFATALEDMDVNMVQQFIDAGADVNKRMYDPDTEFDDTPLLSYFVKNSEYTEDAVKILEMMLDAGVEVDAMEAGDITALGRLTSRYEEPNGDAEIRCVRRMIQLLVDAGADVNSCDVDGKSIMYWAERQKKGICCGILREYGAE